MSCLNERRLALNNRIYNFCMKRRHDYVFYVFRTCCCYGSFIYVFKFGNITPFILMLMTERIH